MEVYLFTILLVVSLVLLMILFFKKQLLAGVFSGVFFLLLGVLLWSGLDYVSSTSIVGVAGNYTVTDHYSAWSNPAMGDFNDNEIIGTVFVLVGLFLMLISAGAVFSKPKVNIFDEEGNDE